MNRPKFSLDSTQRMLCTVPLGTLRSRPLHCPRTWHLPLRASTYVKAFHLQNERRRSPAQALLGHQAVTYLHVVLENTYCRTAMEYVYVQSSPQSAVVTKHICQDSASNCEGGYQNYNIIANATEVPSRIRKIAVPRTAKSCRGLI